MCVFLLFQVLHKCRNLKTCKGCINGRDKEDGRSVEEDHISSLRVSKEDSMGGVEPGPESTTTSARIEVQTYLSICNVQTIHCCTGKSTNMDCPPWRSQQVFLFISLCTFNKCGEREALQQTLYYY